LLLLSLIAVEVGASSKGGLNFGLPKLPFKGKKRGRAGKRREEISVSAAGGGCHPASDHGDRELGSQQK
jgi:hypothetical protein